MRRRCGIDSAGGAPGTDQGLFLLIAGRNFLPGIRRPDFAGLNAAIQCVRRHGHDLRVVLVLWLLAIGLYCTMAAVPGAATPWLWHTVLVGAVALGLTAARLFWLRVSLSGASHDATRDRRWRARRFTAAGRTLFFLCQLSCTTLIALVAAGVLTVFGPLPGVVAAGAAMLALAGWILAMSVRLWPLTPIFGVVAAIPIPTPRELAPARLAQAFDARGRLDQCLAADITVARRSGRANWAAGLSAVAQPGFEQPALLPDFLAMPGLRPVQEGHRRAVSAGLLWLWTLPPVLVLAALAFPGWQPVALSPTTAASNFFDRSSSSAPQASPPQKTPGQGGASSRRGGTGNSGGAGGAGSGGASSNSGAGGQARGTNGASQSNGGQSPAGGGGSSHRQSSGAAGPGQAPSRQGQGQGQAPSAGSASSRAPSRGGTGAAQGGQGQGAGSRGSPQRSGGNGNPSSAGQGQASGSPSGSQGPATAPAAGRTGVPNQADRRGGAGTTNADAAGAEQGGAGAGHGQQNGDRAPTGQSGAAPSAPEGSGTPGRAARAAGSSAGGGAGSGTGGQPKPATTDGDPPSRSASTGSQPGTGPQQEARVTGRGFGTDQPMVPQLAVPKAPAAGPVGTDAVTLNDQAVFYGAPGAPGQVLSMPPPPVPSDPLPKGAPPRLRQFRPSWIGRLVSP